MIQFIGTVDQEFIANITVLEQNMSTTESQLSSGYQITKPSDNPGQLAYLLQLEANLGNVGQTIANLNNVSGEVNTAESALESANQLLNQILQTGTQGASSTASATTRQTLAQQVQSQLSQLVAISNTQYENRYIFSGDNDTQPSYQLDSNSPNGVDQLNTSASTRLIQDATGVTFADSLTAQQIFDARNSDGSYAPGNVFAAVTNLQVALANNDTAGITSAITQLQNATSYLNQQLEFYGQVQSRITNATNIAQQFQLQYQTTISSVKDTNIASASVQLTEEQTNLQAATQAMASMPQKTLFDYL